MQKRLKLFSLSFLFCLTVPGLASSFAIYLGSYGVKVLSLVLFFFTVKDLHKVVSNLYIRNIFFVLILLFSYRFLNSTNAAEQQFLPLISIIWFLLIVASIDNIKELNYFLLFIYIASIIVIFSPGLIRIYDFSRIGFTESRGENALTGIASHYIEYAQVGVFSFFLSYYFLTNKKLKYKIINSFVMLTSLVAIITSGSRGAIISLSIAVMLFFYFKNRFDKKLHTKKKNNKIWYFLLVLLGLYFVPWDSLLDGFKVIGSSRDASSIHRLDLYYFSLNTFLENPFFGNGWDYIRKIKSLPSHSLILQVLAELGIIGLFLEFIIYFRTLRGYKKMKLSIINIENNSSFKSLLLILISIQFCLGIWSLFENVGFVFGTRLMYANLACFMVLYRITNRINKETV